MNAGTHLGETQNRLKRVEAFQFCSDQSLTKFLTFEAEQLQFQYRKNLFLPQGSIIWSAEWEIKKDDPVRVKMMIDDTLARRKATQPVDYPSCGSMFKNPRSSGFLAWQVINKVGLRGHRIGDAQFSEKHSNFILNLDKATAIPTRLRTTCACSAMRVWASATW